MKKRSIFMLLFMLVAAFAFSINAQIVKADGPGEEVNISVNYRTHVQNVGWQGWKSDGDMAGTSGKSLRLEGIELNLDLDEITGGIKYRTHIQNIGWQDWKHDGEMSGTSGKSLRLEAIQIELTGEVAEYYDVYYRVHAQEFGWLDWAKNGQKAGTADYGYRLEAIEVVIYDKYDRFPEDRTMPYIHPDVKYRTHVQNVGWQDWKSDGDMSGTSGRSLRLEGIELKLYDPEFEGGIEYQTHVQNVGWQDWKHDGQMSGTSGKSYRLEGIRIRLTGEMANHYDVYYHTHVQNVGWQEWVKNGEMSGTSGKSLRLEGIEIVLIPKDHTVSYNLNGGFVDQENEDEVETYDIYDGYYAYEPMVEPQKDGYIFTGWTVNGEPYYFDEPVYGDIEIVANWAEAVTITLDLDGGQSDDDSEIKVAKGTHISRWMFDIPTKEGYAFAGWVVDDPELGTGPLENGTQINNDITITAQWAEPVTVTFDSNGGNLYSAEEMVVGKGITLNQLNVAAGKEGYSLVGWLVEGSDPERIIGYSDPITEDMTLIAQWEKLLTVTVDLDGGTGIPTMMHFANGDIPYLPIPTKEGYAFAGWIVDDPELGTGQFDQDAPLTEDVSIKATWTEDVINITLDPNGGRITNSVPTEMVVARGTKLSDLHIAIERQGYLFDGWLEENSSTGLTLPWDAILYDDSNLTAQWKEAVTITINPNGGMYNNSSYIQTMQAAKGLSTYVSQPTKEGYAFAGWVVEDPELGTVPFDPTEPVTEPVTIIAQWTDNYVTLTINSNGGTLDGSNMIRIPTGSTLMDIEISLSRPGYLVSGWIIEGSNPEQTLSWDKAITEDMELTAQWVEEVSVVVDPNGGTTTDSLETHMAKGSYYTPATPTREGYNFRGWMIVTDEGEEPYDTSKPVTTDLYLKATWEAEDSGE